MEQITKGQLVNQALKLLAVSGSLIKPSTEDEYDFLTFLEMMVSSWTNSGIQIGYKLSPNGIDADGSEDSGIAIDNASAVSLCLAVYAASSKGLPVSQVLKGEASKAKRGLYSKEIPQIEPNTDLYMGSGRSQARPFQNAEEQISVENNGQLGDLTI